MAMEILEHDASELARPGRPKVLIADDNRDLAELWSLILGDAGYDADVAASGGDALAAMSHQAYNLGVLDLSLPDVNGLDLFTAMRADIPEVEGIMITGHASTDSAAEALNRGFYGYLLKPVEPDYLRIMVDRASERQRLLLEREEQHRQLEVAYKRERRIAETLQRSLLPDLHVNVPGIHVACLYEAGMSEAEVGGDFYDVVPMSDGVVGVVLGDVSGKGLDAAVYTALTKYTLRSYALEDPDPGHVLRRLNRAFYLQSREETFTTLFFAVIDLRSGKLTYASAGHEPALLYRPDLGTTEWLHATGAAAGVIPDADYTTVEVEFSDHDALLLYTDGASDARRGSEWLRAEGLQRLLEQNLQPDAQATVAAIYRGILSFARAGLRDDTALLLLRRQPEELAAVTR